MSEKSEVLRLYDQYSKGAVSEDVSVQQQAMMAYHMLKNYLPIKDKILLSVALKNALSDIDPQDFQSVCSQVRTDLESRLN